MRARRLRSGVIAMALRASRQFQRSLPKRRDGASSSWAKGTREIERGIIVMAVRTFAERTFSRHRVREGASLAVGTDSPTGRYFLFARGAHLRRRHRSLGRRARVRSHYRFGASPNSSFDPRDGTGSDPIETRSAGALPTAPSRGKLTLPRSNMGSSCGMALTVSQGRIK